MRKDTHFASPSLLPSFLHSTYRKRWVLEADRKLVEIEIDLYFASLVMVRLGGGLWQCADCDLKTKSSNLYNHVESKHLDHPGYNCQYCQKFCKSRHSLIKTQWLLGGIRINNSIYWIMVPSGLDISSTNFQKLTSAGLNSLRQKVYQISVKNWIFDDTFEKKGLVLVILVLRMIKPSGSVKILMKWGCRGHWGNWGHGGCRDF